MSEQVLIPVELSGFKTDVQFYPRINQISLPKKSVIVTDQNVYPLISSIIDSNKGKLIVLAAGEKQKNWESVQSILDAAFELGLGRDDYIIGFGGGVITDLTAFAASLYMRGCKLILYPTTLLAMVDAAFGGKTGINYGGYKNMVGTFYPALELHIITEFIDGLPDREFKCGMAEIIKHGFLSNSELLTFLENHGSDIKARNTKIIEKMLRDALSVKIEVVKEDLRESGRRANLNLGHTFAHALESVSHFGTVSHGDAVAWGIVQAMKLGVHLGITNENYARRVTSLLQNFSFEVEKESLPIDQLILAMKKDKKQKAGVVRFVLQRNHADTLTEPVKDGDLFQILSGTFHDFY